MLAWLTPTRSARSPRIDRARSGRRENSGSGLAYEATGEFLLIANRPHRSHCCSARNKGEWRAITARRQGFILQQYGTRLPRPPAQIPACGFPAPGPGRRSNAIEVRGFGGPCCQSVGSQLRFHAVSRTESGASVADSLPYGRPPSLHHLRHRFAVGFV
jgi:hypothetical protein